MPIRADVLAQLADALAELYHDHGSIQTLATIASLSLARISFYPRAIDTWVPLLNEAEAQGHTQDLLNRAKHEYPVHAGLELAYHAYTDWVSTGRPIVHPGYVLRGPLRAPPPPDTFAGRTREIQKLTAILLRNQTAAISAAMPGMGGVGKTTLAMKLASDLAPHFPAGVVWLEVGYGASRSDLVDRLADAMNMDLVREPLTERRAAILKSALGRRGRVMVILDDLRDIDLGRWAGKELLPADRVLLVTSRDQALCRALCNHVQRLDVLPESEAIELLVNLLGPLGMYEETAKELVKLLDGHPLALEIAAKRCDNGVSDLVWVVRKLRAGPTLGELKLPGQESRDTSVEISLTVSYGDLDSDLQRRFRALGVFAAASLDLAGLVAVWQVESLDEAERIARQLVSRALLTLELTAADAMPTYRQHTLLRAYAWALLERADELETTAAQHLAYYQAIPGRDAENWSTADYYWEQIEQGWQHAWRAGPEKASDYYDAMSFLLYRRARHAIHLEWASALLPLLRQVGNKPSEAQTLTNIGNIYSALGDKQQALELYEQALSLRRQLGDKVGQAQTLNNIGNVYADLGDKPRALELYEQALPLRRQVGDKAGEAHTLNNIGTVYAELGEKGRALELYEQALPLRRQVGDKAGEALTLNNIGHVYSDLGDKPRALKLYEQALSLRHQVGDKAGEANTLTNMGKVYAALGDKPRALELYEQALPLRRQVEDKAGEAHTLTNMGKVRSALGDKPRALELYEQALPLLRQVGDRWGESITRYNIAMVYKSLDRLEEAEAQLIEVVALDEATSHPDLESDRAALEEVREARRAQASDT